MATFQQWPPLWQVHLPYLNRIRALGHESREERKRLCGAGGLDLPPQSVAAAQAAGPHTAGAQRAVEALPGREGGATFVWLVLVMKDERGHVPIVAPRHPGNIGWMP
jgi:hypothetical protein